MPLVSGLKVIRNKILFCSVRIFFFRGGSWMISLRIRSDRPQIAERCVRTGSSLFAILPAILQAFTCSNMDCWREKQSTLVISKSKGLSKILRDISTSTYQICRTEEKINWTTIFHKCYVHVIWLLKFEIYWKYCGKETKLPRAQEQFLLFSPIVYYLLLDIHV